MEFKKLELSDEPKGIKRLINSPHIKRSAIFTIVGAIAGFLFFYLTEGQHLNTITGADILRSTLIGAGFGLFITNSPCARNQC